MRHPLIVLFLLLLCGTPASAMAGPPRTVMCYGDSTTFNALDGTPGYPAYLQGLRPDLVVYNRGLFGDVTSNYARFTTALAERAWDTVIILLGVNDPRPGSNITDPHESFLNLWKMATAAKNAGAEVLLLTPLPVGNGDATQSARQTYTRNVAHELIHRDLANAHAHITIADLRDEFTRRGWLNLTTDGWHPTVDAQLLIGVYLQNTIP